MAPISPFRKPQRQKMEGQMITMLSMITTNIKISAKYFAYVS
jgi:hypothetical protein